MKKTLLTLCGLLLFVANAMADLPFRLYRYDGFKTHKIDNQSIVFLGNSITNMHEWWEAFGNPHIVNRGVNGAESPIMLQHLEAVLVGHPDKIFFMMGTNDLGTAGMNDPAFVANSVRTALKRCQKESPTTKVYFQSILPCRGTGIKNVAHVPIANDSIQKLCKEYGATYIDLYNDLTGIPTDGELSYDGTHLTMKGYRTWCKKIAEYVGSSCVYPDDAPVNNGGNGGIAGMRTTYFSALPIKSNDIVILGDDGNDWHELLNSDHVKQRGGSWGYQNNDIATMQKMLPCIFKGRKDNEEPKMVCLIMGYPEVNGSTDLGTVAKNYEAFVKQVRQNAPHAAIKLMAVIPSPAAATNTSRTIAFNDRLKKMAETLDNVEYYEESYTLLAENNALKRSYNVSNKLSGLGYAKLSQAVANAIGTDQGVTPTTDEEAASRIATFNARNTLVTALSNVQATIQKVSVGTGVGQYKAADVKTLKDAIDNNESSCYALLASNEATNAELTEKGNTYASATAPLINALLPKIILPTLSTEGNEHWYQLYTPYRSSRYMTSQGAGEQLTGGDNTKYAKTMWKFVARTDGAWDIVNRADGSYVNPAAAYDTAISTSAASPASGWTLSYANTAGVFIISSGKVELNQTNKTGLPLYNWSAGGTGVDRDDAGCQFAIVDAPKPIDEPQVEDPFLKGDEIISMETGTMDGRTVNGIRYGKVWTSTRTAPQITLSSSANNIWVDGTDNKTLILFVGSNGAPTTHTLAVTAGYEITGVRFSMSNRSGQTSNVTVKVGNTTQESSASSHLFESTGLKAQSVNIVLSGGKSTGIVCKDFVVSIQKQGYIETGLKTLQPTESNQSPIIYDLSGRRVSKAVKGIYIINGKKVVL